MSGTNPGESATSVAATVALTPLSQLNVTETSLGEPRRPELREQRSSTTNPTIEDHKSLHHGSVLRLPNP
jgi:hypothetical protein